MQAQRLTTAPCHVSLERARRIADFEGPAGLGDDELLALVLGRGADGLGPLPFARGLLDAVGGLHGMKRLRVAGLGARPGVGLVQATRLLAALELGCRAERESFRTPPRMPLTPRRVADWAIPRIGGLEHEEVWVLCVDARTNLRSSWQVGRGGIHGCALLPRDVLVPVVRDAASAFVLVHNHPSGDPTPSQEDLELTRGLSHTADALSVPLLDHIVVSKAAYRSMLDLGQLPHR